MFPAQNRRAFALVLVLIALVISSSMAVFFLTSVARERQGVNLYASGGQVHHLAGMPASRVIGLINAATKEGTAAVPVSWASQPGMIRTYDDTGAPQNVYKLYSWDNSIEAGAGFMPSASNQIPAQTWREDTAHYVDINQKVNDVYPIVDPRAEGEVDGFSVNEGNPVVGGADKENAPMPVKWLYVLEDGQMVAPGGGSGNLATIPGASASNPIIGRVAFWTDDETSKININTASEGNYWDIPRSGSRDDIHFAGNPPVRNEFQRTPGHLAMTSMSAAFPKTVSNENTTDRTQSRWDSTYRTQVEGIYKMSPRIDWGDNARGSRGGTYPVKTYSFDYEPPQEYLLTNPLPLEIVPDTDRLYATADELWFKAPDPIAPSSTGRGDQLVFENAGMKAQELQRRLFFLTANSRAPETTLFETPRVSLWPITWPNRSSYFASRTGATAPSLTNGDPNVDKVGTNPEWITAQERLIAFCGTLNAANTNGGDRYFFQRKDPDSPVKDWTNIQRNQDLVDYLLRSMGRPVPGFSGGTLESKLDGAPNKNWVALNVLNFARSQVNQYTAPNGQEGIRYSFSGVSFRSGRIKGVPITGRVEPNAKIVTPLRAAVGGGPEIDSVGNFPVLEEAVVLFYAAARREPVPPALPPGPPNPADAAYPDWRNPFTWQYLINPGPVYGGVAGSVYPLGAQTTVMRAVLLLDFTGLEPGVPVRPTFWVKVTGGSFSVNGSSIGLPSGSPVAQVALSSSSRTNSVVNALYRRDTSRSKIFSNSAPVGPTVYQLVSNDIKSPVIQPEDVEFSFSGQRITVTLYACDPNGVDVDPTGNSDLKVYEKVIDFAPWTRNLPMPTAPRWSTMSRVYSAGAAPAGVLPGGTGLKSAIPAADQPSSTRWRPNPDLPGTSMVPAETRPVSWAWSEFAPILSSKNAALPDVRSKTSILQERNRGSDRITYYYRTGGDNQAKYNSTVRDTSDPDDARETGDATNNMSTNFRKRVEALDHRNTNGSRTPFYIEGTDTGSSGSSGPYYDMFLNFTEDPFRESLPLITPYDTAISMVNAPTSGSEDRDPRLAQVPLIDDFKKISTVMSSTQPTVVIDSARYPRPSSRAQWHHFSTPGPIPNVTGYQNLPTFRTKEFARRAAGGKGGVYPPGVNPGGELGNNTGVTGWIGFEGGILNKVPNTGDWTGMPGRFYDGGMLARPDQEYQQLYQDTSGALSVPFYPRDIYGTNIASGVSEDVSYFSPNRQVPSPVILGTIPRSRTVGWQTLAFSPNPAAGLGHPGLATAPNAVADHLLLDLFWMPVAEPYPISEQLSTAGKVNLNYRIMPFPYIERKTAMYALMKSTWMPSLDGNDNNVANYKSHMAVRNARTNVATQTRHAIDINETLKDFDEVFNGGDLFRSASQLCTMFLVPQVPGAPQTLDTVRTALRDLGAFWTNRWLTPDNAREQPYNDLYSRVTTKSNTFTVHWRVQSLRKTPNTDPAEWDESRDRQVSELRGSTLIERYIDSNATNIPDYAKDSATATPLSYFYKWRVVAENYFQP